MCVLSIYLDLRANCVRYFWSKVRDGHIDMHIHFNTRKTEKTLNKHMTPIIQELLLLWNNCAKKCLTEKLQHFNMLIIRTHCNNGGLSLKTIFTTLTLGTYKTWNQIHEITYLINVSFSCANENLSVVAFICACIFLYIHPGHWMCIHTSVYLAHTSVSFVLWQNIYSAHTCMHVELGGHPPTSSLERSVPSLMLAP